MPTLNPVTVKLYSDNTGTTLVSSSTSTTGNAISIGSDVYEYTLDTPFDVTSGTQMLAYVEIANLTLYTDVRSGFTYKFGSGTNNPTNIGHDWFIFIQYVYMADVPPAKPGRRRVIITE